MFQIYSKTTNFVEKLQQQNCIYTELTTQLSQVELRSKELLAPCPSKVELAKLKLTTF